MQWFEFAPVVSEMIEEAESEHAPVHRATKRSTKHPGRQELPANLPRVERILPCAPDQRLCKRCGRENGGDRLRGEFPVGCGAAEVLRTGHEGEKRVCRCEELDVVSAPLPLGIIEKCLASDLIVTDMVVSKCCNHMPWRFARMRCRKMMFPKISG
jgi:transposase